MPHYTENVGKKCDWQLALSCQLWFYKHTHNCISNRAIFIAYIVKNQPEQLFCCLQITNLFALGFNQIDCVE